MNLKNYLIELEKEMGLKTLQPDPNVKLYEIGLPKDLAMSLKELEMGFTLFARVGSIPLQRKEDSYTLLMRANFLGQGTGGSVLALDPEEKFLTLSRSIPYEMDFKSFKECLEDFLNYVDYWKTEMKKELKSPMDV